MQMTGLRVLVLGKGGREHAIATAVAQSPTCEWAYVAPGNPGTSLLDKKVQNVDWIDVVKAEDVSRVVEFAKSEHINLVIVGPEVPLMLGVTDALEAEGIKVFGPSQAAAELEGSKAFAKELMRKSGVPTARFENFMDYNHALAYMRKHGAPVVIKASGLAAGKGVVVAQSLEEAENALNDIMVERIFGEAGDTVVIEEFLVGREVSIHVLCDGRGGYVILKSARDHKRVGDHDTGPNTGGMGAFAPVDEVDEAMLAIISKDIIEPTLQAMLANGHPFKGCLYVGLMLTKHGPKVLEYNVRFGDPETQVILPLIKTDLLELLWACASGQLDQIDVEFHTGYAVCVVMAAHGYPGTPRKGDQICGHGSAHMLEGVSVFHAGTSRNPIGQLITNGGRVFSVVGVNRTLRDARWLAYYGVQHISFEGEHHRTDIGA